MRLSAFGILALLANVNMPGADAFYVPGLTPAGFVAGDPVPLSVNKVSSELTQLPYRYYDLPVCVPKNVVRTVENLGEVLRGDRIESSDYQLNMLETVTCRKLCERDISAEESAFLSQLIKDRYRVEWIVDNLPSATVYEDSEKKVMKYEKGFKLGNYFEAVDTTVLNNHVRLVLLYNPKENSGDKDKMHNLIVGFEVYPRSIAYSNGECPNLETQSEEMVVGKGATKVVFSYSVEWRLDDSLEWNERWDMFLSNGNPQIHWYSIINSIIILLLLTSMAAVIILRALSHDIAQYNEDDSKEESQEDITGWKLVHGDVFRPPSLGGLLAPAVGSGLQFLLTSVATMCFAVLGFLNPSYRGGLISFAFFSFIFMGVVSGYYSSRLYKVFKGTSWQKNALMVLAFPASIFVLFMLLNSFVWAAGSSIALPVGTFFALSTLFVAAIPLQLLGAYFGFKKKAIEHPVRTNQIPRQIPEVVWYLKPGMSVLFGGLLPFAVIFIELSFILKSIWQDQYYYMFGFLFLVLLILVVTCVEVTIVIIYFQLCAEDYNWWWKSFFISSSSAFYIFTYAVYYFASHMHANNLVSTMLYFTYSLSACFIYFLVTGTIGFIATYYFLMTIYSAVKVD